MDFLISARAASRYLSGVSVPGTVSVETSTTPSGFDALNWTIESGEVDFPTAQAAGREKEKRPCGSVKSVVPVPAALEPAAVVEPAVTEPVVADPAGRVPATAEAEPTAPVGAATEAAAAVGAVVAATGEPVVAEPAG